VRAVRAAVVRLLGCCQRPTAVLLCVRSYMDALGTFRCLVRCAAPSHTPAGNRRQWAAPAIAQRELRTVAPLRDAAPMEQSNRAGCALIVECPHCTALGCSTALGCTGWVALGGLHWLALGALHWVGCTGLHWVGCTGWVALGGLRHTSHLLEHDTCRAGCMQHDTCDETFGMARAMQRATMRWQANLFEQHYFLDFYTFKLDIIDHHGLVFMRLLRASKG
jgi:hypothetical protein